MAGTTGRAVEVTGRALGRMVRSKAGPRKTGPSFVPVALQFLANDLAAPFNADPALAAAFADPAGALAGGVRPLTRRDAVRYRRNRASGRLDLASVYGPDDGGRVAARFAMALRDAGDRARLLLAPDGRLPEIGTVECRDLRERLLAARCHERLAVSDPLIGDRRNLAPTRLSRFHLRLVRLHNDIAATMPATGPDKRFRAARQNLAWTWQWVVINTLLPAIGSHEIVRPIAEDRGAFYRAFLGRSGNEVQDGLPIPLEFCSALRVALAMTGARRLDAAAVLHDLALNLPSGPSVSDEISAASGLSMRPLSERELARTAAGRFIAAAGLERTAPLTLYLAAEAESRGEGERLGRLGTAILAGTLLGLVVCDPASYQQVPGSGAGGLWHPEDSGPGASLVHALTSDAT